MAHSSIASVFREAAKKLEVPYAEEMTDIANDIASDARDNVGALNLPAVIASAITVGTAEYNDGVTSITVSIDVKKDAPMAAAFEFGSGTHRKDDPDTYPIVARNEPLLHFYWANEQKWFRGKKVNHPGVEAKPYFFPAVEKNMQSAKAKILNKVVGTLSATFNTTVIYAS